MKTRLLFLLLGSSFFGFSSEIETILLAPYVVKKDSLTPQIGMKSSVMIFHVAYFDNYSNSFTKEIQGQIDGSWYNFVCDERNDIKITTLPGMHKIELYLNANFESILLDSHSILAGHTQWIDLFFENKNGPIYRSMPIEVDKPVIYTYGVNQPCTIQVKPAESFIFTYPAYGSGWIGTAQKDGSFAIGENTYPYLFWEATQTYQFHNGNNGFDVRKENVISFLEQKLGELGFTQREKTDFITYWGPKMARHERIFVQFEFNSSCDTYATIDCSPAPDGINRVYISFCSWDESLDRYVKPMVFDAMKRTEFYLFEWGGFEFEIPHL